MTITKKHTVILHSKDRSAASKSAYDCQFHLNDYYLHQCKHVKLKQAAYTNLIYNVTSTKNTLNYESGGAQSIVIPVGYYNSTTLATAINGLQAHFVIAENSATKKYDFTSAGNTRIYATSTVGRLIGVLVDTSLSMAYSGDSAFDFVHTHFIHVLSTALSNNDSVISSNNRQHAVIASLPVDVGYGFVRHVNENRDTANYSEFNSSQNISTIDIKLVDDDMNQLDLNGSEWTLTFSVYT